MPADTDVLVLAAKWGWALLCAIVAWIWNALHKDIALLKQSLKEMEHSKADRDDIALMEQRAETSRNELRATILRLFDRFDQHARDTQERFDTLQGTLHEQNLTVMQELNKKADR